MGVVKVKICGITRLEDALGAIEAGADALGFMFYPASPRHLAPSQAAQIIRALPEAMKKIGVFVNATEAQVRQIVAVSGINGLQFHGEETPTFCRQFGMEVIKTFRIRDAESVLATREFGSEIWLLDSYVEGKPGGTGTRFNWDLAASAVRAGGRVMLAGGLTPENAGEAVRQVQPYGLDVSSGVESAPGIKDPAKIRAFIAAAKQTGD